MEFSFTDVSDLYSRQYDLGCTQGAASPKTSYVIATTPRSGSTHLSLWLYGYEGFGLPLEYLNLDRLDLKCETTGTNDFWTYWSSILQTRTDPKTGVFGVKCFAHFAKALKRQYPVVYHSNIANARIILLERRDALAQAVSYARALQTRRWFSSRTEANVPHYDRDLIERALQRIKDHNVWWGRCLAKHQAGSIRIYYEDFVEDQVRTLTDIANFLDISDYRRRHTGNASVGIQRDEVSAGWISRFLSDSNHDASIKA